MTNSGLRATRDQRQQVSPAQKRRFRVVQRRWEPLSGFALCLSTPISVSRHPETMHPAALCNKNAPQINNDNPARQQRLANVKADGGVLGWSDMNLGSGVGAGQVLTRWQCSITYSFESFHQSTASRSPPLSFRAPCSADHPGTCQRACRGMGYG